MSKLIEVSLGKEFKVGLPNFSNITTRADLKWQLAENETPDWDAMWDEVNHQMSIQNGNLDPAWINQHEYKNFFKIVIKSAKGGETDATA